MVFSNYYFSLYNVYAYIHTYKDRVNIYSLCALAFALFTCEPERMPTEERWRAGVETQKNVRGEIGGWGRVPFNEPYAPSLSTIYNGALGSLNS